MNRTLQVLTLFAGAILGATSGCAGGADEELNNLFLETERTLADNCQKTWEKLWFF